MRRGIDAPSFVYRSRDGAYRVRCYGPAASGLALLEAIVLVFRGGVPVVAFKKDTIPLFRRIAYVVLSISCVCLWIRMILVLTAILPFLFHLEELSAAIHQYKSGDYIIAEGLVSSDGISRNRTIDCFLIGKTELCTSIKTIPVGYYRNGAGGAEIIKDGMNVRVFYHGPVILRVDVLD